MRLRAGFPVVMGLLAGGVAFGQGTAGKPVEPPAPVFVEQVPPQSDNYPVGPDSKAQAGAPAGKTFTFELNDSKVFPGTKREITVYIPAAYHAEKPAAVYVGLDGLGFGAAVVFDNLIAQRAMPVTIGIGVAPGTVGSANKEENPRFDRSMEFDSRNERLARFLLEEVLPAVEGKKTPGGLPIRLSADPNDRAIGGSSTGGIGAFTVAWERPDAFRRVFISIGTFVGMRGGEGYYVEVRKTEPKPLRVFMQDGAYDEWGGGPEIGDWWMSNRTMERALSYAGYDVKHVWGVGTHNGAQAAQVFPDAMRWLWRDWPAPVAKPVPGSAVLKAVVKAGEDWRVAADGCATGTAIAADAQGHVVYGSGLAVSRGGGRCAAAVPGGGAVAFGPDGRFYAAVEGGGLRVSSGAGSSTGKIVGKELRVRGLSVRSNGDVLASVAGVGGGELWRIGADGKTTRLDGGILDGGIKGAAGVAVSPDGLWVFAAQSGSRMGLSYRMRADDGTLDDRESFYDFFVPTWADDSGAGAVTFDREGHAYVATRAGVQMFDRNGRVVAILPLPGNAEATGLCFGGENFDQLYVVAGGKIFVRTMSAKGVPAGAGPVKLPPWGGG